MAWQKNGTPITLTGVSDDLDITDLSGLKFNQFLLHRITSGNSIENCTLNNDSGSNYAKRGSFSGGSDTTLVTQVLVRLGSQGVQDSFIVTYAIGISSEEKLLITNTVMNGGSGAGNVPERAEIFWKWADTTNTIDRIDFNNVNTGDYGIDTNLSALGTD